MKNQRKYEDNTLHLNQYSKSVIRSPAIMITSPPLHTCPFPVHYPRSLCHPCIYYPCGNNLIRNRPFSQTLKYTDTYAINLIKFIQLAIRVSISFSFKPTRASELLRPSLSHPHSHSQACPSSSSLPPPHQAEHYHPHRPPRMQLCASQSDCRGS